MKEFKTEAITENLHSVLEFIDGQLELIGCPMKPQMQIDISVEEIFVNIARYLCPERSNAFVVAMLWYAMLTGSDIRFEAPVSKQLYDGLTGTLITETEGMFLNSLFTIRSVPRQLPQGISTGS